MKKVSKILMSLMICALFLSNISFAQEISKTELKNILKNFKNYRFGSISLYQINNMSGVKAALKTREEKKAGVIVDESAIQGINKAILDYVEQGAKQGKTVDEVADDIRENGEIAPARAILEKVHAYYMAKIGTQGPDIQQAFLVTTRALRGEIPKVIIGLIVSKKQGSNIEKHLKQAANDAIFTYDDMMEFKLDSNFKASNLYDLMMNDLIQQNCYNKTLDAQGIGNSEWYAPKVYGKTISLADNESDYTNFDIQNFMKISEGQPTNYSLFENEVVLSPDLISWKRYSKPGYEENGVFVIDSFQNSNNELPKVGLELRYGIEDINYPSMWSERLTASALWQSIKLGIILPTSGWAQMTKDAFNVQRKLTHAGVGIAGAMDFPVKVIPKSGLFHFSFGYVFGDAVKPEYTKPVGDTTDYLIRGNATLMYTFGMQIDEDYLFRFGIGGSVYNVERWYEKKTMDTTIDGDIRLIKQYLNSNDENIGGLTGKVEFMARNVKTPYGASVQYFDESLYGNIWLQIPLWTNRLALKFDVKASVPAFRNEKHDWEINGIFIPMARLIATF